jgi:hypothetical protein
VRLVGRTVDGALDETAVAVQELAFLPVHLGRHMRAAVEVRHHDTTVAKRERPHRPTPLLHIEHEGASAVLKLAAGAKTHALGQ